MARLPFTLSKICSASLLASTLMATAAHATVGSDGWYLAISGGVASTQSNVNNTLTAAVNGINTLVMVNGADYKTGWNVAGGIGYKSGPLRYEGEVTYVRNTVDNFTVNGTTRTNNVGGRNQDLYALFNVYYDFDSLGHELVPFLAAGIGWGNVDVNLTDSTPGMTFAFGQKENEIAYQFSGGVAFNTNANNSILLAYRYLGTTKADKLGKRSQHHIGSIGFVHRFDMV